MPRSKRKVFALCSTRDPDHIRRQWLAELSPFQSEENEACVILPTSGSSGIPKAVCLTFAQLVANAESAVTNAEFSADSCALLSLPLYHVGGLSVVIRAALVGGNLARKEAAGVTHLSLVPTQLYRMMRDDNALRALSKLKVITVGGAPLSPALVDLALGHGLPMMTTYGLSEMGSQVAATKPGASREELLSSGRLLANRELVIVDGEICVKGPSLFSGYVEGAVLRKPVDAQGFFHTGDMGFVDEKGLLHVRGRKDNMMISGGENIQAEEIEAALRLHEGVEEAVVVAKPDAEYGQRPVAFVKAVASHDLPPDTLRGHLEQHVARFKIPDTFLPWPSHLPGDSLKIQRRSFQRELALLKSI